MTITVKYTACKYSQDEIFMSNWCQIIWSTKSERSLFRWLIMHNFNGKRSNWETDIQWPEGTWQLQYNIEYFTTSWLPCSLQGLGERSNPTPELVSVVSLEPMLSVRGTFTCKTMLEEQLSPNFTEPNVVGSNMLPGRVRERERGEAGGRASG